ncbi:MAG: DUF1566 domain-containing protein [candidate division KSB1 bacterium]|nr:DUF1566 domain-containing protein [candidate division KSB1 bacterium]MDZ7364868.1 DUF1566 domain-containing protein [candidate division KSB1 bacterium]MDZ7402971.1 DUF1566 domain-containing protein [candidate division KSB1 bacterium]
MLQRENEIHGVAKAILKEVREIREKSREANLEANFARFETEYRLAVARKLDQVELFGVDVSTPSRRHQLSVAYISLSASGKLPSRRIPPSAIPDAKSDISRMVETGTDQQVDAGEERISKTVDDVLAGADRLMIRGLAGSGKTTLVKWVAVQCAAQKLKNGLADLNHRIPFVIFLRQCVNSGLPAPENFVRHLVPLIADKMPGGWVHQILESGRAVVMIDGVDEVPQLERHTVYQWIKELGDTYEKAKFLVTTRPTAVNEGWLAREGFAEFELEPMDLTNIYKFLEHWHLAVREELQSDQEKSEIDGLESSLREFIKQNRPIRNLATNPLLCATICALHRDRKKQIPAERLRLYDACCEMLLERRGKEQQLSVDLQYAPTLSYSQKLVLLQDLAYYMIRNEASVVSFEEAEGRFAKKIMNFGKDEAKFTAAEIREFLVERSGLLRVPIETKIDFVHRTFQEFLGAKAAVDENDLGLLIKNATNDQWREVIILAVGHAPRQIRKELISKLLERGDREQAHRHQLHFLAVACLETAIDVDAALREQVNQRVAKLIPPKNFDEAKAIALTGDLAAPLLVYKENLDEEAAVACVQALKLINSDTARGILRSYGNDSRRAVVRAIAKDALDDELFRREVLFAIRDLFLHVPVRDFIRLENLQQLGEFPQIRFTSHLDLGGCDLLKDLSGLPPQLPELTTLSLRGCTGLNELSGLPMMPKLRSLNLCRCTGLEDLSGLTVLAQNASVKPIKLRDKPNESLSGGTVKLALQERDFFDFTMNKAGKGLSHFYVAYDSQKESVVMDYATGLMWQQGGTEKSMGWKDAQEYIEKLNREKFAGYDDWRLPTLEEAMSLMEPKKMNGYLYIDPVFDPEPRWIWTADKKSAGRAWYVDFNFGGCVHYDIGYYGYYVRAVRS